MRTLMMCMTAAGALTLAACDGGNKQTVANPESGERVTLESGSGTKAPPNMPAFAPLYPGARIESTVSGVSSQDTGSNQGGMVSFRVADDMEKVAAFYRSAMDRSGLTERTDVNMNGTLMIAGAKPDNADEGLQVTIAPNTDGPGSFVSLVYSLGGG